MKENLHNERESVQTCNFASRNQGKHGEKLEERACMRNFETKIQELKTSVLTEVSRLTWEDRTQTGILDIPEKIIPGPGASLRCCIYKERAIISSRAKLALGGDQANPCVVELLPIACDECPVTEITVGDSCRGCLATRCVHACPKDAIQCMYDEAPSILNYKIAEYTKAVVDGRPCFHVSLVMDVSPNCDCHGENDVPIVPNGRKPIYIKTVLGMGYKFASGE